jgi:8-oxo-dGTP pyrophosphatase MutT (NUDIX family)|tara:strand:- start:75 stop:653 length:579 start_codon:yes stop_codon:yes gene_type:complete
MGGAGILPVAMHRSKLYYLFGKENMYEYSAPGFADFGGTQMNPKETQMETAIRESSEELTGFLGDKEAMRELIMKKGNYAVDYKRYRTYIVPIKYDKKLEYYFNNNMRYVLSKLPPKVVANTTIFEKQEIRWVCEDDLMHMRDEFRVFYRHIVDKVHKDRKKISIFVRGSFPGKTRKRRQRLRKKTMRKTKS